MTKIWRYLLFSWLNMLPREVQMMTGDLARLTFWPPSQIQRKFWSVRKESLIRLKMLLSWLRSSKRGWITVRIISWDWLGTLRRLKRTFVLNSIWLRLTIGSKELTWQMRAKRFNFKAGSLMEINFTSVYRIVWWDWLIFIPKERSMETCLLFILVRERKTKTIWL